MPSRIARRLTDHRQPPHHPRQGVCRALALACILARGHLLIEDIPGVGKTTPRPRLARLLGLQFQRIQFTSDMLPADIIGVSIFDQRDASFRFHPGPVFAQLLLADEINRATPKAQSALLEAMEERQISAEGQTWRLPEPFFVIATQNPADQIGTFPLPESQLDRFLMRISLGYPTAPPSAPAGRRGPPRTRRRLPAELRPASSTASSRPPATSMPGRACSITSRHCSSTVARAPALPSASPRAGLGLLAAAPGLGAARGRDHVLPEDVQAVLPAVAGHRLRATGDAPGARTPSSVGSSRPCRCHDDTPGRHRHGHQGTPPALAVPGRRARGRADHPRAAADLRAPHRLRAGPRANTSGDAAGLHQLHPQPRLRADLPDRRRRLG